jgi:predicted nucleotidyltransferase
MELLLFGSAARGTADDRSDYDVLVALDSNSHFDKQEVIARVEATIGRQAGISIYGMKRLSSLWADGSPFAWHLHLEGRPLVGSEARLLEKLGEPSPYRTAAADSEAMVQLLHTVVQASADPGSTCYEAGIAYVCSRNIAMFASIGLLGTFDFSRAAPFALSATVPFPLTTSEYDTLISARHATTRGKTPPAISQGDLARWSWQLLFWGTEVVQRLWSLRDIR